MKRRLLLTLLTIIMAIALTPIMAISVSASTPAFSGGTGTKDDPFLISTADDLVALKDAVLNDDGSLDIADECGLGMFHGYHFKLTNDIDMAGVSWEAVSFCGNIDGAGYSIKNLSVEATDNGDGEYWSAMFAQLINATITNITFENCSAVADNTLQSTRDVYVSIVSANAIASKLENITIKDCTLQLDRYAKNFGYAGFISALADISNITGCNVEGGLISASEANTTTPVIMGSIVGCFEDLFYEYIADYGNPYNMQVGAGAPYGIYNCTAKTNITSSATNTYAGGIVGETLTDYYDDANSTGIACEIVNCYYEGTIQANGEHGTVAGISRWDEPEDRVIGCIANATLVAPTQTSNISEKAVVENSFYLSAERAEDGGRTAEEFANGSVCTEAGKHLSATATCKTPGTCIVCGEIVTVEGVHESAPTYSYASLNSKTHDVYYECCELSHEQDHSYDENGHCALCGATCGETFDHVFDAITGNCTTCGNFVAVATLTTEDGLDIEYFITLQDAVDRAQTIAGSKITLLCDIELSHWVEITSGEFTIDFEDKVLDGHLTNTAIMIDGGNITLIGIETDMHIDLQTIVYGGNVTAIDVIFSNLIVDGGSLTYENCKAEYIFFYSGSLKLKSGGVKCLYIEEDSGKTPVDVLDKDCYFYNEDTLTDASKIELDSYNEYKITNFTIKQGANLSEYASVELEYTQAEYTGSQLTPNATVKVSGITVDPANYEVVYTDNVGVGTATVTVNAIGEFYSGSISTSFEITKATPKYSDFDIVLTNGGHGTYDGNVWEATVTAKAGVIGMGEITVKYYDALGFPIDKVQNAGHYTAFVDVAEGTNYNAITDIFISDIDVSSLGVSEEDFTITGLESEYVYSGESINPEITVILFGKTLEKDKDYELLYPNDKNVGEYQFNLLIGGNYYGSFTYDYKIVQATPVIELTLPAHSLMPSNRMAITATSNAKEELAYAVVDGEGYSVDPSDPMVIIVDADALIGTTLTVTVQNLETANYAVGFKTVEVTVVSNEVDLSGIEQDIEDLNTLIAGKADSAEITLKLQEINGKIQLLEDNGATDLELTTAKEQLTNAYESALASAVTELEGKIDAQVDPTELATAIDGVEALIGAIPAEYIDVADYVAKVKTALESALQNAVTQLEGKIDAQVDPTELATAIDGVEALIGAIPAEYVDVADYVAKVKTALESALESAVTELENADKQNADALTKAVADFNKLIGVIPTEYADVATYVASVKSTIEKALNEKVAELKATDSQLQNAINTNSDSISNLTDQLANRYAELKALVGELPDGVASVKDYVDGINQALESADSTLKLAIEKVATDLENAQAELESAIKQGDSELSAKIEKVNANLIAVENALKLADKAIKEEFDGKIESAKTTLNNAINTVQKNLDKAKLELQISIAKNEKVLSDKITALNEALNEATALLQIADENLKNELTAKIDEVNTTLESAIKAVQKNLDKAKEELENSIANGDEALSTRISDLSDALKDAISVLQKADDSLKSELTEKIETVNAVLENAIKMVEKHLDEAKLELENAIKQGNGELDDKITNLNDALADAINTLEIANASNKDALLTKINEVYSTLDSAIKAVQKNLDDKTQMLEKSITSNKLVLDEKYNELKTFTIVVCVVSGVALLGSSAFVIWFFINRRKR